MIFFRNAKLKSNLSENIILCLSETCSDKINVFLVFKSVVYKNFIQKKLIFRIQPSNKFIYKNKKYKK